MVDELLLLEHVVGFHVESSMLHDIQSLRLVASDKSKVAANSKKEPVAAN